MDPAPAHPPDHLEREIFELAAKQHVPSIRMFLLYIRAQNPPRNRLLTKLRRLEPLLYRFLNLNDSALVETIEGSLESESNELAARANKSKSLLSRMLRWNKGPVEVPDEGSRAIFLKTSIRHIWMFMFPATAPPSIRLPINRILRLNPNLFELLIEEYSSPVPGPQSINRQPLPIELRPTHVTVQFDRDDGLVAVNLSEPLFSSVTHLTLLNIAVKDRNPETWPYWSVGLLTLRAITHLGVMDNIADVTMPQLLTAYPHLQRRRAQMAPKLGAQMTEKMSVSAARCRTGMMAFEHRMLAKPNVRVALVAVPDFYEAWEGGVRSGDDLWKQVEDFIAHKRLGEIDGMCFILGLLGHQRPPGVAITEQQTKFTHLSRAPPALMATPGGHH
ncbi:hypothetical protein B0H13DRAFT_1862879 [Mycena leptocephala]|nr:hypothetical protein B0H13DRAFT_1862879 [Mycena leptocephala]